MFQVGQTVKGKVVGTFWIEAVIIPAHLHSDGGVYQVRECDEDGKPIMFKCAKMRLTGGCFQPVEAEAAEILRHRDGLVAFA